MAAIKSNHYPQCSDTGPEGEPSTLCVDRILWARCMVRCAVVLHLGNLLGSTPQVPGKNCAQRGDSPGTPCSKTAYVWMPGELLATRCSYGHHALRSWQWTSGHALGAQRRRGCTHCTRQAGTALYSAEARREAAFLCNVSPAPPPERAAHHASGQRKNIQSPDPFPRTSNRG